MSIIAARLPVSLTRPRVLARTFVALLVVIALGAGVGALYSQLTDTRAALVSAQAQLDSTQSELDATKGTLASVQTELDSTKSSLAATQSTLADTQADRDAKAAQVDTLNANLTQLTSDRDAVQAQLTQAHADLQSARNKLTATSAQRDRAQSDSQDLAQAGLLMTNVMKASSDYEKILSLQLNDLSNAVDAAVRFDWVSERVYVAQYKARQSDQWDKSSSVYQSTSKLQTWMDAHPASVKPHS